MSQPDLKFLFIQNLSANIFSLTDRYVINDLDIIIEEINYLKRTLSACKNNVKYTSLTKQKYNLENIINIYKLVNTEEKEQKYKEFIISNVSKDIDFILKNYESEINSKYIKIFTPEIILKNDDEDDDYEYNFGVMKIHIYSNFDFYISGDHESQTDDDDEPYIHPHVGITGNLCEGDAKELINNCKKNFRLLELLDIIIATLNTYNSDSPYLEIEAWREKELIQCTECGRRIEKQTSYVCSECNSDICSECIINNTNFVPYICASCNRNNNKEDEINIEIKTQQSTVDSCMVNTNPLNRIGVCVYCNTPTQEYCTCTEDKITHVCRNCAARCSASEEILCDNCLRVCNHCNRIFSKNNMSLTLENTCIYCEQKLKE